MYLTNIHYNYIVVITNSPFKSSNISLIFTIISEHKNVYLFILKIYTNQKKTFLQ